jgi:hypothetical protein
VNLRALENSPDADFLREIICFAAQRLMELEVEGLSGAIRGERARRLASETHAQSDN